MTHVTLVAPHDRQLEDTLRTLGVRVTRTTIDAAVSKPGDVVILDLRDGGGVPASVAAIRRHHPETGVIVVASTLDPALLLEAMRAGVNEVLPEPITGDELQQVIGRLTGSRTHAEPGQVHAFVGAKGGVGTTTIAVNVAAALGAAGKPDRSLLMDLHRSGGDATILTGAEPRFSMVDASENTHRLDETFLRGLVIQTSPCTDLLASPEREVPHAFDRDRIQRVIAFASSVYKHTVIDLPRSDVATLDMLDELTRIYIVANQELTTVKSAGRLASTLRERFGREKIALVIGRSDRQAEIGREDIERAVGSPVMHVFPSDYRAALEALNKGRPVALDGHNDLSASFKRFAVGLAGARPESQPARATGLFGRLSYRRS